VSVAASLQRKEIIDYTWGTLRILKRKNLEASACECKDRQQNLDGSRCCFGISKVLAGLTATTGARRLKAMVF